MSTFACLFSHQVAECRTEGANPAANITWFKNKTPLASDGAGRVTRGNMKILDAQIDYSWSPLNGLLLINSFHLFQRLRSAKLWMLTAWPNFLPRLLSLNTQRWRKTSMPNSPVAFNTPDRRTSTHHLLTSQWTVSFFFTASELRNDFFVFLLGFFLIQ